MGTKNTLNRKPRLPKVTHTSTTAVSRLREAASAELLRLQNEDKAKEKADNTKNALNYEILSGIYAAIGELFGHFGKDRLYQEKGAVYFTEYDVRERDTNEPWPSGTFRIVPDEAFYFSLDHLAGNTWNQEIHGTASVVITSLVKRIYQIRKRQGEHLARQAASPKA